MFLLVLRGVVNDGGVAGALGVLRVEVELDGDPGVQAGHLEDGDLVGHLPANQRGALWSRDLPPPIRAHLVPQLHLLRVVELHQKVGWQSSIKT